MPMPVAIPTPMLYGVKCTEVSQRAYSGQTSAMKSGFDRLQRLDSGKVEYRTIVSRWEATSSGAPTGSSEPSASAASSRNNPNHAAQLMSLANYIRHILSLTAGNPNAQPSQATVSNNQPQKQEATPKQTNNNGNNNNSNNIAQEPRTSISRPLKAMSSRRHRHRYSPDYHDHAGQRHARYLQHQQYSDYPTDSQQQPTIRPMGSESFQGPYDQDYREGNDSYEQHLESPHFHPQQQPQHQPRYPAQQYQQDHSYPPMRRNVPQLPKVPFPNLTLTLALIYVDRLKAKNPEAKGEQGCSHRLFLIAFIIAAKYRCSVALSPPLSQESENSLYYDPPVVPEEDDEEEEQQSLESRLNSELIFSNHAWVRLLNLGSFARTPATPTSAGSGNTGSSGATLPISSSSSGGQQQYQHQQNSSPYLSSVPSSPQVSETSTMASNTPVPTTPTQGQTPNQAQQQPQQLQSLSSIMHSVTQSSSSPVSSSNAAGSVLQVEDLDRMEAEFLTFLNFDLATMSHDLETCWNLLVGKKD
ncbi:hypothetical protein BGZ97_005698 [Linnemannia gamsii]|uniref:Cyclin N-terminal domain-containing protein n=1 Tax=Linnemannia gamsii TaxID=64522 RepID=A0A9P6RGF6_9FUNG|nr:hypothetical protein BGZ97_005698 [Linnemannia gamsii]